jgi:hypothetical protein
MAFGATLFPRGYRCHCGCWFSDALTIFAVLDKTIGAVFVFPKFRMGLDFSTLRTTFFAYTIHVKDLLKSL